MPSFLVSFTIPGGELGLTYGSHVLDLPEAPSTAQSVVDLQASMAMEYGSHDAILLTWDLLPDSSIHPGGSGPYCYFLTYSFASAHGAGLGSMTTLRTELICTLTDLRFVEEWARSQIQAREVHLVSCKALREPTQQLLQDYEQMQLSDNSE
jgi:hypothetical protein